MGILDFFTGGNAKVMARRIANTYSSTGGNYKETYMLLTTGWLMGIKDAKNPESVMLSLIHI